MWAKVNDTYSISDNGEFRNDTSNKTLKPEIHHKGYLRISAHGVKPRFIHRLVAIHFIPNPDNLPQVNHIDGDKLNNNVSNLEWCTNKENSYHYYSKHGYNMPNAKIDIDKAKEIKSLFPFYSTKTISKMFGLANITIQKIKQGVLWKDA